MTANRTAIKQARVEEALRLHDKGLSIKQTAERMGVANETVRRYLRANGIPFVRKATNKGMKKLPCGSLKYCSSLIAMLYIAGVKNSDIASICGCSNSTVVNTMRRRGYLNPKKQRGKVSEAEKLEMLRLANEGLTTYQLGDLYGVNHATVSGWLRDLGLKRTKGSRPKTSTATCDYCGCEFIPTRNNQRYCSRRCRDMSFGNGSSVKRARKYGVPYDRTINLKRLVERDGLRCSICGKVCDMEDKRWGDYGPDYPTIDHIVPISKGGPHLWDNVQIACAECNIVKGSSVS